MRKLWPNLEREDALETVLEVPLPEDSNGGGSFPRKNSNISNATKLKNMKSWMRFQFQLSAHRPSLGRGAELQLMLGVLGAPLLAHPLQCRASITSAAIKADPIETSMAKYIMQQYLAATGGEEALGKLGSMYAMGKLHMKIKSSSARSSARGGETGGFVLWQQRPHLWCIELLVSGCKITAGSNGKVAWRQTPWQQAQASRGPPRPLRRCIQGVDPRLTADLFSDAVWVGEKRICSHDCFVLRVDTKEESLHARSSRQTEVARHTMWGYFSQKTGLLVQIEDSQLLKIQRDGDKDAIYWETNMESSLSDYRTIEGVNIAHCGCTTASLLQFPGMRAEETKSVMEETWEIKEIDFNIMGLSMDCFLPPADLKLNNSRDDEATEEHEMEMEKKGSRNDVSSANSNYARPLMHSGGKVQGTWFGPVRVMAIDGVDSDSDSDSAQAAKKL